MKIHGPANFPRPPDKIHKVSLSPPAKGEKAFWKSTHHQLHSLRTLILLINQAKHISSFILQSFHQSTNLLTTYSSISLHSRLLYSRDEITPQASNNTPYQSDISHNSIHNACSQTIATSSLPRPTTKPSSSTSTKVDSCRPSSDSQLLRYLISILVLSVHSTSVVMSGIQSRLHIEHISCSSLALHQAATCSLPTFEAISKASIEHQKAATIRQLQHATLSGLVALAGSIAKACRAFSTTPSLFLFRGAPPSEWRLGRTLHYCPDPSSQPRISMFDTQTLGSFRSSSPHRP
ncbi:hypothetical protein F5884DRAFT_222498 [Xylogone sp. PMI_703]|nr:hypothetical protein F5884DRAFT_222498 [Xylogone sp. PMI_703]